MQWLLLAAAGVLTRQVHCTWEATAEDTLSSQVRLQVHVAGGQGCVPALWTMRQVKSALKKLRATTLWCAPLRPKVSCSTMTPTAM